MKNKLKQRVIASLLSVLMVVTLLPANMLGGGLVEVLAATQTYTLDPFAEFGAVAAGDANTTTDYITADGYFQLLFNSKSRVDEGSKTFSDGVVAGGRFNTQGTATTSAGSIKFTTANPATVKVWWASGGDGREITILDSEGTAVVTTAEGSLKNSMYISTLELTEAGTYYLGSSTSSQYIYYVTVTENIPDAAIAVEGSVKVGETVVAKFAGGYSDYENSIVVTPVDGALSFEADPEAVTVEAGEGDALGGTYSAEVDTAGKFIKIYNTTVEGVCLAQFSYKVAGALSTMVIGQDAEAGTFKNGSAMDVFGATEIPAATSVFSTNNYIKITNTSDTTAITADGKGHGLSFTVPVDFTVIVPAQSVGQFSFAQCLYANSTAEIVGVEGSSKSLKNTTPDTTCGDTYAVFEYRNLTEESVEVTFRATTGGTGYINGVSYQVVNIPDEATVTGTIDAAVAGGTLTFTSKSGTAYTTTVQEDGTYSIVLGIGTTYSVALSGVTGYRLDNGASLDLSEATPGATVADVNFEALFWNVAKVVDVTVGGSTFTVTPGATESDAFTVELKDGDGEVEVATATKAIVWANLGGNGEGTVSEVTCTEGASVAASGNTVTITYTGEDLPTSYTLQVKDNSATGIPVGDGSVYVYNLLNGSVISKLYDKNGTTFITGGKRVSSTDKLLTFIGNNAIKYNDKDHGITMNNGDAFELKVAGKCTITLALCKYPENNTTNKFVVTGAAEGTITPTETAAVVTTDGTSAVFEYTGDATTLTFTLEADSTSYLHSINVKYPVEVVEFVEQTVMPSVPADDTDANTVADTDGNPRGAVAGSIVVKPVGQKLTFAHTGGSFNDAFAKTGNVGYYLFPMTDEYNVLEFDLLVTKQFATGNDAVFVGGIFTNNYVYSLGLRAGGQKIRGIYSKNSGLAGGSFAGAGSPTEEDIGLNRPVHYKITRNESDGKVLVTITFIDDTGVKQSRSFNQGFVDESALTNPNNGKFYYGFAMTSINATITNMIYKDSKGTVLYDQNSCYYAKGTAPIATSVTATPAETREYILVEWEGETPEYDGTYVVEKSTDGGKTWEELASDITEMSYKYELAGGEGGNYLFRVCGQLGKEELGGSRTDYVTTAESIYVLGALKKPLVEIAAAADSITISWNADADAEHYNVYRYSYDEGEAGRAVLASELTETTYTDTTVTAEMPYYYQVEAVSTDDDNASPLSDAVWQVATAGHAGDYVYEDEAANIVMTKKPYDTVFTNTVEYAGVVEAAGTMALVVNGTQVDSAEVTAGGTFAFTATLAAGRNDVNLLFTDASGNVTRKTFNTVYLTNYHKVVDKTFEGEDGTNNEDGIPTYKTVQAAVDSVSASNSSNVIILVKAGDYNERLLVTAPNITLIGEDRENTLIHCYPYDLKVAGVIGTEYKSGGTTELVAANYEAGGDMEARCASKITSAAKNFTAENLSIANDYVYATPDSKSNKSADAIRVEAENSSFVNVKLVGVQDTLYMHSGKQYYYKCRIEGLVDFIYSGDAARSYFNDCEIVFVYESTKTAGYVAAPKTAANATYGLTFNNCVITAEEGCAGVEYLLARPWGADAYITWINCYMGDVVNELAPYGGMSGNMPEDARFFEYGTYGPAFLINAARRQISPAKAAEMVTTAYLGWDPAGTIATVATGYTGSVTTTSGTKYVETTYESDEYMWTDGDDTGLKTYDVEGYASAYDVTGGGLLLETSNDYYKVSTGKEFLDALLAVKKSGAKSVIELTADIGLGCNEVENFSDYSSIIKGYSAQPLTHPTLIETGVSQLTFQNVNNLTIFSQNGSSILHTNITMKKSENIIIRNIKFDELWEWDEATEGDYDRNDWDYMTIDQTCNGVWIDHCTFYKAYDGIVDIKNPSPTVNVTISWCEFLPGSEDNLFFDVMMDELKENAADYPYYSHLLEEGMTEDQIYAYCYGQKKTHLLGQSDDDTSAAGIRLTLANNYYKDSMDRMPRLRYGKSHVYNCIMDAQNLLDVRLSIENEDIAKKIVSNGASSTCGAEILLENCFINGIQNALNSGNGSSPSGYINAINSAYYMNGVATTLEPKCNSTGDTRVLITDADAFIAALPYAGYKLYDAEELEYIVPANAGAGKLDLTVLQWEKTSYNTDVEAEFEIPENVTPSAPTNVKASYVDGEGVVITWNGVRHATGYVVERADAGSEEFATIATINEQSTITYTDATVEFGKAYSYRVSATNETEVSEASEVVTVQVTVSAPTSVSATALTTGGIKVMWAAVDGVDGYNVYRLDSEGEGVLVKTLTGTAWTDTDVSMGQTYSYYVTSYFGTGDDALESAASETVSARAAVMSPTNASAKATTVQYTRVSFTPVDGVDGYIVYRRAESEKSYTYRGMSKGGTSTYYTDPTGVKGTKYFYYVVAYVTDDDGKKITSKPSNVTSVVAGLPAVTGIKATNYGKNKVQITWSKSEGTEGYIIYRKTGSETKFSYKGMVKSATTLSYIDNSASESSYNFYRIYPYATVNGVRVLGPSTSYVYSKAGLKAVSNLKATGTTSGVKLTWSKVTDAEGYIVYGRRGNSTTTFSYVGMTSNLTYTDTKALKTYYNFYRVYPYYTDAAGKRVLGPSTTYVYAKKK